MITLILSDIHDDIKWADKVLNKYSFDKIIFIGDFFDSWTGKVKEAQATAKWLQNKMAALGDKAQFCLGNHDMHYMFRNNSYIRCSGYENAKNVAINEIMKRSDWDKFKLYVYEQGYYISHGGMHEDLYCHPIKGFNREFLDKTCEEAFMKGWDNQFSWYLAAGECRGGMQPHGGINWLDWNEEFEPIENVSQIVGHTQQREPQQKIGKNSINYCIDCGQKYYGILEDGKFRTEKLND